jgi:cAMP-dependent protein kinase regulator
MYEKFLASVPIFEQTMTPEEISQVAECLNSFTFTTGQCIFKQNDEASGIYFVESGNVRIIKNETANARMPLKELGKLSVGEYFGEIALISKKICVKFLVFSVKL